MKKSKWIISLVLVFSLILQIGTQIFANSQAGVVTSIKITDREGNALNKSVEQWESFRINVDFKFPDGQVKAGDTTVISLPKEIAFVDGADFPINDANGNLVANATINQEDKTVTLVYTNYAENHSGVNGSLFFYVRVDHFVVEEKKSIPIDIKVENQVVNAGTVEFVGVQKNEYLFTKSGWRTSNDNPRLLTYGININQKPTNLENTVVIDRLATPGITIQKDSFIIKKGNWKFSKGEWHLENEQIVTGNYNVQWDGDNGFRVDLGILQDTDGIIINYNALASYDLVDGEIIKNNARLQADNLGYTGEANFDLRFLLAGGQAEGYVYAIQIVKQNEQGEALQGARFDVIRKVNGMKVGTIETDGTGSGKIEGLLKDIYELVETDAPDGYDVLAAPVEVKVDDFTNKLATKVIVNKKSGISVTATKEWENGPTVKPTIYFKLFRQIAGGQKEEVPNAEIKELVNGVTEVTWTDLPKADNAGQNYIYSVKEVAKDGSDFTPEHYTKLEDGLKVKNTFNIEKIQVVGRKIWENGPAIKPTIKLQLQRDGQPFGAEVELQDGVVEHTWTNLDKTDNTGMDYVYSVEEVEVPENYEMTKVDAFTVKNTFKISEMSVKATKEWVNGPAVRPTIYFKLFREIAGGAKTEVPNAEIKELVDGVKEVTWDAQPKTDKDGNVYIYSVKEVAQDGSDFTPEHYTKLEDGLKVTNTYNNLDKTQVVGRKVWENGPTVKPTIKLQLQRNGQPFGDAVELQNGVVEYTWANLDKTDNMGRDYVYSVEEVEVPENYEMTKVDAFTVKNTFKSDKISIPVKKVWYGANLDKIVVNLKADGKVVDTFEITEAMKWQYEIKNLDRLNSNGVEIKYEIEEEKISGYISEVDMNDVKDVTKGFTITNTQYTPPKPDEFGSLKVTKEWVGIESDEAREVKVYLVRNGEILKDKFVLLNNENNWTATFEDLKKENFAGVKYAYSFKEENEVDGEVKIDDVDYKVIYTESKVINKKIEKVDAPINPKEKDEPKNTDPKKEIPKTSIAGNIGQMSTLLAISGIALAVIKRKR